MAAKKTIKTEDINPVEGFENPKPQKAKGKRTVKKEGEVKGTVEKTVKKIASKISSLTAEDNKNTRLTFEVRFSTEYGQNLFVVGDHELLGNDDLEFALPLQYLNDKAWSATIELHEGNTPRVINYRYFVKNVDGSIIEESLANKSIDLSASAGKNIYVSDFWSFSGFPAGLFETKPFLILLNNAGAAEPTKKTKNSTHVFTVKAPVVSNDQVVCMLGDDKRLGGWEVKKALKLYPVGNGNWQIELDLSKSVFPIHYKFGLLNTKTKKPLILEGYENRCCALPAIKDGKVFINEGLINLAENA